MLRQLLVGFLLMAFSVAVHAAGISAALRHLRNAVESLPGFWTGTRLLVRIATWVVLLHLGEISAWAILYWLDGSMPDLTSAMYFSAVTYTTTGYGDLVLPAGSRLVGGMEALTGILMCGWSTGFFFAVVNRFHAAKA